MANHSMPMKKKMGMAGAAKSGSAMSGKTTAKGKTGFISKSIGLPKSKGAIGKKTKNTAR